MRQRRLTVLSTLAIAAVPAVLLVPDAGASPPAAAALARSPELTATTRLADRRSFVIGDRFYAVGTEDGGYPAEGFHTRGEMGGFWSMPIKLLDGVWFGVDGTWPTARSYTTGWGYTRMDLGSTSGVGITRTDVAPDGLRAGLVGLTLTSAAARTVTLTMDAHSELMSAYPWGETAPSQLTQNLQDTGAVQGGDLVFRDRGTNAAGPHDWAAVVGSTLTPQTTALGAGFRGPVQHPVVCGPSGPDAPPAPARCDDTAYGRGTGGRLTYRVQVPAGQRTVWFSVAGSDHGLAAAQAAQQQALAHPADLLAAKVAQRRAYAGQTAVELPGDPQLAQSVAWSKQNLLDARQQARDLQLRVTNAGTEYPAPVGTQASAQWIGAGWPDYPWIFGTDGEYTAFAAVAAGQFDAVKAHLRTLQQISDTANRRSGKVVHEVVPDGSVFFGANSDAGNTDESVKFPSAVALVWRWTGDNAFRDEMYDFTVRNLRYVFGTLDVDRDGWLEGSGNVETPGMGTEKLDNSVYAVRGLLDLADLARSKGDTATVTWATAKAADLRARFEQTWWNGASTQSYADSLQDPGNQQVFQRHWIGLTPVEAELPGGGPVATTAHAQATVAQHERPCFTGANGLFHTGTGATSDAAGNPGPTCDPAVSSIPALRDVFTLTTSIAAVAEAAVGRTGPGQLQRYTSDLAKVQVDPALWEAPGLMPEISPSPDFGANISKSLLERSMGLQAWGAYGVLWPVVHFELGIAPDLGNGRLVVVPQVPDGQHRVAATQVLLGTGSVDVTAERYDRQLTTTVTSRVAATVTVGAVLPAGSSVARLTLNGVAAAYRTVVTARGTVVQVDVPRSVGTARLVVGLR